ncbi:uncharacterized protein METZ01_LOCUS378548, partial [marine metagenome]
SKIMMFFMKYLSAFYIEKLDRKLWDD